MLFFLKTFAGDRECGHGNTFAIIGLFCHPLTAIFDSFFSRRQAKSYRYLYLRKLLGKRYEKDQLEVGNFSLKSFPPQQILSMQELEDRLDVYNITLARGLAEADVSTYLIN